MADVPVRGVDAINEIKAAEKENLQGGGIEGEVTENFVTLHRCSGAHPL